jgi:uncharacterized protein
MTPSREPLPSPTPLTSGFWEAARRHELVIQQCQECGLHRHYPQYLCPRCSSPRWTWSPVSGRGHIYTFTVTHQPFSKSWGARTPYAVAVVELEEGVRMVSDLSDAEVDRVEIGQPVEVYFEDLAEVTLPRFRLAGGVGPQRSGEATEERR